MAEKIFISYSRKDESFARKLAQSFSDNGLDIWIDTEDIPAGMNWSNCIDDGLKTCDTMILIVSPSSMGSKQVELEWQFFHDMDKLIIPVIYIPVQEFHYHLQRTQYVNFYKRDYDDAFEQLFTQMNDGVEIKHLQVPSNRKNSYLLIMIVFCFLFISPLIIEIRQLTQASEATDILTPSSLTAEFVPNSTRSFKLVLNRASDLLTIYIEPLVQPLNLSDLSLRIEGGKEEIILLNSEESFTGVLENVISPICLILYEGLGDIPDLPKLCSNLPVNSRHNDSLNIVDIFWFSEPSIEHALTILLGDEVIKHCATQSQCEITYPPTIPLTPTQTPIPTPIVGNILPGTYPTSASGNITLTGFTIDISPVNNTDFGYFINAVTDETGSYSWEKGMDWWTPNAEEWVESNAPRPLGQRETQRDIRRIITWYEAAAYCKWRGGQLPTAEEWEIAYQQNVLGNTDVPIEWINPEFSQIISVSPGANNLNFSVFEISAEGTPLSGQASFRCIYKNTVD